MGLVEGVFAVRKPTGMTSSDVVQQVKEVFLKCSEISVQKKKPPTNPKKQKYYRGKDKNALKIGHGGTLDPLADGVLVLGLGSGTKKLQDYLTNSKKTYKATVLFGSSTTTQDSEGKVLEWGSVDQLDDDLLTKAVNSFKGELNQYPPIYSALKVNGKPLYEYARSNIPLPAPIEPRKATVYACSVVSPLGYDHQYKHPANASKEEIDFNRNIYNKHSEVPPIVEPKGSLASESSTTSPIAEIRVSVSSGTYIRAIIDELGRILGTKAHMVQLTRETQGIWNLESTIKLDDFSKDEDIWLPQLKHYVKNGPSNPE